MHKRTLRKFPVTARKAAAAWRELDLATKRLRRQIEALAAIEAEHEAWRKMRDARTIAFIHPDSTPGDRDPSKVPDVLHGAGHEQDAAGVGDVAVREVWLRGG